MKKLVTLFLTLTSLLLPLSGYAQEYYTVQEIHEQVEARWTQTYQTKWREIPVDVQPFVPEVAAMPVLKVVPSFEKPTTTEEETGWKIEVPDYSYLIMKEDAVAQEKLNEVKTQWISEWIYNSFDLGRNYANSMVNDPKKELRNYEGKDVPEGGTLEYSSLAINAQTGEMQDYMNNKDDSDDYIGFIPWDEVGVQN